MIRRCKKCGGEDFRIFDYYVKGVCIRYNVECRNCNKVAIRVNAGNEELTCTINLEPVLNKKE